MDDFLFFPSYTFRKCFSIDLQVFSVQFYDNWSALRGPMLHNATKTIGHLTPNRSINKTGIHFEIWKQQQITSLVETWRDVAMRLRLMVSASQERNKLSQESLSSPFEAHYATYVWAICAKFVARSWDCFAQFVSWRSVGNDWSRHQLVFPVRVEYVTPWILLPNVFIQQQFWTTLYWWNSP